MPDHHGHLLPGKTMPGIFSMWNQQLKNKNKRHFGFADDLNTIGTVPLLKRIKNIKKKQQTK
jgi:hypothetical protein